MNTADQFITRCATGSFVSGIDYTIRFANGATLGAATWLRDKLAACESENARSPRLIGDIP